MKNQCEEEGWAGVGTAAITLSHDDAAHLRAHDVLLRRRVPRVQQVLVGHVVDADAQVGGGAQVNQLDLLVALAHNAVGGLDVAVHDACAACVFVRAC